MGIFRCKRFLPLLLLIPSSLPFPRQPLPTSCVVPCMGGLEDFGITEWGGEDWCKPVVWWYNFFQWGIPETAWLWWLAREFGPLTGDNSHSLELWLISTSQECCTKISLEYLPCNAYIGLSWKWGRLLIGCSSFHLFIFALGIRGGRRCGLLNAAKTWKTTRMNIARPILACF